jgi:hypothetical protein
MPITPFPAFPHPKAMEEGDFFTPAGCERIPFYKQFIGWVGRLIMDISTGN